VGMIMEFFAGGDASDDIQTPQVAATAEERETNETGRTLPQSEAENIAIEEAKQAERDKQLRKQSQQDTILTGSLGSDEEPAAQRKTLLGA
jgi:hypothetical protein